MSITQGSRLNRREFLGGVLLAGTSGFLGFESPCAPLAGTYIADPFLEAEGFSGVQYVQDEQMGCARRAAS